MVSNIFCKADAVKNIEENSFKNGMPVAALMEKAGLKSAWLFKKIYPKHKFLKIGIFIGPGHNGGDALVVARELFLSGYKTYVYCSSHNLKKLTADHLSYYLSISGETLNTLEKLHEFDILIDGIFGYGLKNNLDEKHINLINTLNNTNKDIVSLDLPSGMNADFGNAQGACIKATHTFCLGVYKYGLIQDYAVDTVGKLHFIDIGLNTNNKINVENIAQLSCNFFIKKENKFNFKKRNINKYSNGVCLLFSGSNKYPGAGFLSVKSALASGAGYIQLCCTEELKFSLISKIPDIVCHNLDSALLQIEKQIHNKNFSILCGSGLDKNEYLEIIIEKINSINEHFPCLIIDASSLNSKNFNLIKNYPGPKILTPHTGEFAKMFPYIHEKMLKEISDPINESTLDKVAAVKAAAKEINGTVLLKGPHTVISNEKENCFVDMHSTSALARAGCGDVLAGFITGLVAKGYSPFTAACLGVISQSRTAMKLEKKFGISFVNASHLARYLKCCAKT